MANPISTINFFCACVTATTTRQNLWTLVQAAIVTPHAADLLNFYFSQRVSTLLLKAPIGNANTIYLGDSTMVASATVPVSVMDELAGGDNHFEPFQGGGAITVDMNDIWIQTTTGTAVLYVGARRV